jgi:tRNA(fMet)-specific endonuclease VapC
VARRYALDTGVANLVALSDAAVLARLDQAESVFVPFVVVGELYFGAYRYAYHHNSTKYLDLYDDFLLSYRDRLLTADAETGQIFGAIRAELTATGSIIQHPDMWVAALARQYGLTVATPDADFARISALAHEIWP